jgi:hypothetical protein
MEIKQISTRLVSYQLDELVNFKSLLKDCFPNEYILVITEYDGDGAFYNFFKILERPVDMIKASQRGKDSSSSSFLYSARTRAHFSSKQLMKRKEA